jgi:hypothetical protein
MANRFPLIANASANQIQELASGDFLDLSQSGISNSGNILVSGIVSATGNITASYLLGNGSQITGLPAGYANADVAAYLASGTVSTNILTTALISATGNVTGGNIRTAGSISAAGNITGANINSVNADLAEMYVSDVVYAPGTVVEFGGENEITITTQSHSTRVAGIVSTSPSYLMNTEQTGSMVLPIALTGRVPCSVVGNIEKGDRLVASNIAGVAEPLNLNQYQPACIIGKALQNYNSDQPGVIEVAVGRT